MRTWRKGQGGLARLDVRDCPHARRISRRAKCAPGGRGTRRGRAGGSREGLGLRHVPRGAAGPRRPRGATRRPPGQAGGERGSDPRGGGEGGVQLGRRAVRQDVMGTLGAVGRGASRQANVTPTCASSGGRRGARPAGAATATASYSRSSHSCLGAKASLGCVVKAEQTDENGAPCLPHRQWTRAHWPALPGASPSATTTHRRSRRHRSCSFCPAQCPQRASHPPRESSPCRHHPPNAFAGSMSASRWSPALARVYPVFLTALQLWTEARVEPCTRTATAR